MHTNSFQLVCTLSIRVGGTYSLACRLKVLLTDLLYTRTVLTKTMHAPVANHCRRNNPNYLGIKLDSVSVGALHAFLSPK